MCRGSLPVARHFSNCSSFIGPSVQPKSKVLAVICWMPPPEPIDW
jgi:hypothetical protein